MSTFWKINQTLTFTLDTIAIGNQDKEIDFLLSKSTALLPLDRYQTPQENSKKRPHTPIFSIFRLFDYFGQATVSLNISS